MHEQRCKANQWLKIRWACNEISITRILHWSIYLIIIEGHPSGLVGMIVALHSLLILTALQATMVQYYSPGPIIFVYFLSAVWYGSRSPQFWDSRDFCTAHYWHDITREVVVCFNWQHFDRRSSWVANFQNWIEGDQRTHHKIKQRRKN